MKKYLIAFCVLTGLWSNSVFAEDYSNFLIQVDEVGRKYAQITNSEQSNSMILEGHISKVNHQLSSTVADKNKTAMDYFVLSNILYRVDQTTSNAYIKKANELLSDNPYIIYELAMHEHRAQNCQVALPLYKRAGVLSEKHKTPVYWAYVTHCQLVTGKYSDAIDSWKKANFGEHHTSIEKGMYEIFSNTDPESKREKIMSDVSNDSQNALCELLELDKNWETDWWNIGTNSIYLNHDLKWIERLAQENAQLKPAKSLCVDAVALDDVAFKAYIIQAGYWTGQYKLPDASSATFVLIRELIRRKIATSAEIFNHYGTQLQARFKQKQPVEKRTLDMLAYLYDATNDHIKLKEIDEYGWKVLKLQVYAESYVRWLTQADKEQLIPLLAQEFPNSDKLQVVNLTLHEKSSHKIDYLAKYVASQFANVKNNWAGPDRLNNYMNLFESELK